MAEDPLREIRTMILLSLPYPPLPIRVDRVEADANLISTDDATTTTHSLLAICLNAAVSRNEPKENAERKPKSEAVFQKLLHDMATRGFDASDAELYTIYCRNSLAHIATYFPNTPPPQVEFRPLHYITTGDATHTKMCEYMAGQSVLFEDSPVKTTQDFAHKSYSELLRMLRDRLGHIMTVEEQAQAELKAQQRETCQAPA